MASRSPAILRLEFGAGLTFPRISPSCGLPTDDGREPANIGSLLFRKHLPVEAEAKDGFQKLKLHPEPHHVFMAVVRVHIGELDILEEFERDVRHLLAKVVSIHSWKAHLVFHQFVYKFECVLVYL